MKEKRNRFEQTSRTLERKITMRSTKDQLVKKDVLMPVKHNVFPVNLPDVEESFVCSVFLYVSDSPLVSMEKEKKGRTAADSVQSGLADCGSQSQAVRAQAQ
ncbi:hypothetical protein TNCV_2403801 [Trichonephila clavipes]|uniref:Uncharacterized protein n=1 Tax=Trichonephila clavipes TaxID=2585209 RepID=A0A8X6UY22_TRICX|nr:hypothetical protein TNCV_2403801 [Trichonephila clavipes]